ncbi:MAG: PIN domain-containing protein [Euryarchaeota archaeon]|nr:PIN domain-containing protein [Euryarchaeota archaeon]
MLLFIDTSAFLALEDESDKNHISAIDFRDELRKKGTKFRFLYTSNYAIDETLTLLRYACNHKAAVTFGEKMRKSKAIKILRISEEVEEKAWKIFKEYSDKDFSFTDCTSFAIMEAEGIQTAFAYDEHFKQYGFSILP